MRRRSLIVPTLLATLVLAAPSIAQTIGEEADALAEARRQAIVASKRSALLEGQAARASDDAARARAEKAAIAARIQAAEADIAAAQARIRLIEALRARQRARLAAQQGPIVRLVAALQTMARRPPALVLVQPGSLTDLVHVRSLLATTLPIVQARTAGLRAEVEAGNRLRRQADHAVATLRAGEQQLQARRLELARLEVGHRRRSQRFVDAAMFEQDRAISLGEQARDIVDLIRDLDSQAEQRDRLAELSGPVLRPAIPGQARTPVQRVATRGERPPAYRLPVVGRLVTGFGEVSDSGIRARGLTLATAPSAQVVAPTGGRIAYAGGFKKYGQIVIIDHGRGWTTLITDLASVAVNVGETVDQGSPIGRAGGRRATVTVELRRDGQPIDIVPMVAAS
jgi:septal ring factor EnvC (AmiA/AmiB activator)